MRIPSLLAGVAGEYFVAAELSTRGHIASISLRNTRGIDILATNKDATRSITIQCKTNQLAQKIWILNEKSEDFVSDTHFYIFVALGNVLVRPFITSFQVATSQSTPVRHIELGWIRRDEPDASTLTRRCGNSQTQQTGF
ncbi:MAG TPA: hypothetical protein VIV82_02230 [Verrucomicrobiae bacterium]